jgi:hypothetical protein
MEHMMSEPIDRRKNSKTSLSNLSSTKDASQTDPAENNPEAVSKVSGKSIVSISKDLYQTAFKNLFGRKTEKIDKNLDVDTVANTEVIIESIINYEPQDDPMMEHYIHEQFYNITIKFMLSDDKSLENYGNRNLRKILSYENNVDTSIIDKFNVYLTDKIKLQQDPKTIQILKNTQSILQKHIYKEIKQGRYIPDAIKPKDDQDTQPPSISPIPEEQPLQDTALAPEDSTLQPEPQQQEALKAQKEQTIPINQEQYINIVDNIIFSEFSNYDDTYDLKEDINHKLASVTTELMASDNKELQKYGLAHLESILENRNTNKIIISNFFNYFNNNNEILVTLTQNNLFKKVKSLLNKYKSPQDYNLYAILNKAISEQLAKNIIATDINILKANPELQQKTNEQIASITTNLMAFPDTEYSRRGANNLIQLLSNEDMNTTILENFYSYVKSDNELKKTLQNFGQLDTFYELCHAHDIGTGKDKIPDYTELKTSESKAARNELLINIINENIQQTSISNEALEALNEKIYSISINLILLADEELKLEGIDNLKQIIKKVDFTTAKSIYNFIANSDTIAKKDKTEINKVFEEAFQLSINKKLDLITQNFIDKFNKNTDNAQEELQDIHNTQNYTKLKTLKSNFIRFNKEIKKEYIDNLTEELKKINNSNIPFDLTNTRTVVSKEIQYHYQKMMDDKIYNSLLTPQELSELITYDLNNGLISSVLKTLNYKHKNDIREVQKTVNEILHDLNGRQKLIQITEAYQNTSSVLDEFDTAFDNSFSDIYALEQIQYEIDSAKIPKSSVSNNFFSRIKLLFKRIKNYFISGNEIKKINSNSQKIADIGKNYATNLELFKTSIENTKQANLNEGLIDEMAYNYIEQNNIINFEKSKLDMSFYNLKTIKTINEINEILNEQQEQEFYKSMQDISMSIANHQQSDEQQATKGASSAIFLYAFNKALELVRSHNLEGYNIGLDLKNSFIHVCNKLNNSHINLDYFGFKNGIQIDKLKKSLNSTYQQPTVITDNTPIDPITPQTALEELSDLNTEIEDSTLDSTIKNIFNRWINSISDFVTKKINKPPE